MALRQQMFLYHKQSEEFYGLYAPYIETQIPMVLDAACLRLLPRF